VKKLLLSCLLLLFPLSGIAAESPISPENTENSLIVPAETKPNFIHPLCWMRFSIPPAPLIHPLEKLHPLYFPATKSYEATITAGIDDNAIQEILPLEYLFLFQKTYNPATDKNPTFKLEIRTRGDYYMTPQPLILHFKNKNGTSNKIQLSPTNSRRAKLQNQCYTFIEYPLQDLPNLSKNIRQNNWLALSFEPPIPSTNPPADPKNTPSAYFIFAPALLKDLEYLNKIDLTKPNTFKATPPL